MLDPEYLRLIARFEEEAKAGNYDLALTYSTAAIKRGDELLAAIGGTMRFLPIATAAADLTVMKVPNV